MNTNELGSVLNTNELGSVLNSMIRQEATDPIEVSKFADRKLNEDWVKERTAGGGKTQSYIPGHRAIRLLREATKDCYSYTILQHFVQDSAPKPFSDYNPATKKYDPVYQKQCESCGRTFNYYKSYKLKEATCKYCNSVNDITIGQHGYPLLEPQPPVTHVLGRLIIPGMGTREQWGSHAMIGGYSEQESAFKSASTDALKKCATMFGFAIELYDNDEEKSNRETHDAQVIQNQQHYIPEQQPMQQYQTVQYQDVPYQQAFYQNYPEQQYAEQQQPMQQQYIQQQPMQQQYVEQQQPMQQQYMPEQQYVQPQGPPDTSMDVADNTQAPAQQAPAQQAPVQQAPVQQAPAQQAPQSSEPTMYNPDDVATLKKIKIKLGEFNDVNDPNENPKLTKYVVEFNDNVQHGFGELKSFTQLSKTILPAFNKYMIEKYGV